MGRLKTLKPALASLPNALGWVEGDAKATDRRRDVIAPWRSWYRSKRWADLRMQVFVRDRFVCQRTGELCSGRHPEPHSPVANHKTPHKGDPALFWDIDNIETVAKHVHDSLIQAEERAAERN